MLSDFATLKPYYVKEESFSNDMPKDNSTMCNTSLLVALKEGNNPSQDALSLFLYNNLRQVSLELVNQVRIINVKAARSWMESGEHNRNSALLPPGFLQAFP